MALLSEDQLALLPLMAATAPDRFFSPAGEPAFRAEIKKGVPAPSSASLRAVRLRPRQPSDTAQAIEAVMGTGSTNQ